MWHLTKPLAFMIGLACVVASAHADRCTQSLGKLQGYTVHAATQVDGDFEGCDFNKVIRFMDGKALRCSSYSYLYAFMPDAIIFAKSITYQGKSLATVKVLIECQIFDMEPVVLK